MGKIPFNYGLAFQTLKQYSDLKIRKNKVNFTPAEKTKITKSINALKNEGVLYFSEEKNKYVAQVKFVKSATTKNQEKVKGIKIPLKGKFVRGARANAKIKNGKIIGEFYDKIFIPLDIAEIEEIEEGEEYDLLEFVEQMVFTAITPYYEEIEKQDYFTVAVANGWEIGRGKLHHNNYPRKKINIEGGKVKKVIDREKTFDLKDELVNKFAEGLGNKQKKVAAVSRYIGEMIERINNRNNKTYKLGMDTIKGIYLYQYKKQAKQGKKHGKAIRHNRRRN